MSAGTVQVCTAAMTYGFRIVEEMKAGLSRWMDEKGLPLLRSQIFTMWVSVEMTFLPEVPSPVFVFYFCKIHLKN